MPSKESKKLVADLMKRLEEPSSISHEDAIDALLFVAVVCAINEGQNDPKDLIERLVHKWVKVNSLLSKVFTGEAGEA